MNWETVKGLIERIVAGVILYATGKGWITEGTGAALITATVAIAQAIWTIFINRPAQLVSATASLPEVKSISVTESSQIANKTNQPEIKEVKG